MPSALHTYLPITNWGLNYQRADLRGDVAAGLTIAAMLIPQAMAYALLAGLPPIVGLYAATVPVIVYALLGTSGQLAVGPVAIVSLLTATALAPLATQGTAAYLQAAAILAVMVGALHLLLGVARLGFVVNFLSHSVLVGFTAAAAIIIGFSQATHIFGVEVPRTDSFLANVSELIRALPDTHAPTMFLGLGAFLLLLALKKWMKAIPGAFVVVVVTTAVSAVADLGSRGVGVVGSIPAGLPRLSIPGFDGGLIRSLITTAAIITVVGFMESVAVAKVYARRNRYEIVPNQELLALGGANLAAGLTGGYPVTGGFSRTAVNANAGARTPLASLISAALVVMTLALFTPVFEPLPKAALAAIIIVAVINLVDIAEMRHIAQVKRSDLVTLVIAFGATLILGIELGIGLAVVASMLVVFWRLSTPHTAVLGRLSGTTTFRNLSRYPDAETTPGVRALRIDAELSFVNAAFVKKLLLEQAIQVKEENPGPHPPAVILDCSGINDLDITSVGMLTEVLEELESRGVDLHLSEVRGPIRDVLHDAHLWDRCAHRIHHTTHDALQVALTITDPTTRG
jgi:SulP family sulfate permease